MKRKLLALTVLCLLILNSSAQTFTCGDTLLDVRDGKKYLTVLIGSQCWMKQNLNYGKTVTSYTSTTTHTDMYNNSIAEKYAPNGDSTKLPAYGGLYEWDELMNYTTVAGGQGLCPANWHVPTDAEWQTMIVAAGATMVTTTGGSGGNKLKAIGEGVGPGIGTNTSGFSAKAAGDRDSYGIFYGLGLRFIFWTSTQTTSPSAYQYTLWAEKDTIARDGNIQKITGLSCRCVLNSGTGIDEHSFNNKVNVYPNPASDRITLKTNSDPKEIMYEISDINGRIILNGTGQNVDIKILENGLYFIRVVNPVTKMALQNGKFVKQ